jgi:predicted AAA+ superfamily ATPase
VNSGALLSAEPAGPPSLRDGLLLGALFESLVTLSVRVYAQAARARVSHLRTRNGDHEVDLIVERRDGRVLAIETKLAATPHERDVRHLDTESSLHRLSIIDQRAACQPRRSAG